MRKHKFLFFVLLCLLSGVSVRAQKSEWLSPFSPGLQKFLTAHPENFQVLTNILTQAFTNRTVRFFYFYTRDNSVARAEHFYPNPWEVHIMVGANQEPVDEFFCVIYESINSEGEKRFEELMSEAAAGSISRTNFAREITRQEFVAVRQTRYLLKEIKLTKKEVSSSNYYKYFAKCPEGFDDYLDYIKRINQPYRDVLKEYETKYDLIRKYYETTNGPP